MKLKTIFFSWICLRIQTLEKLEDVTSETVLPSYTPSATDWCADADDWGDGNANIGEENGNLVNSGGEKISDEEEESCSLEESIRTGFGNLNFDDKNANTETETQGG